MPKPRLFIGSSKENLEVARVFEEGLKDCAEIKPWYNGVFDLNKGYLESLLETRKECEFALFIIAGDDLTTSKAETLLSPRDNVLFESGLLMGELGRDRVFLVCDESAALKIPSDFAGVTLASYNGAGFGTDPAAAVKKACGLISGKIVEARYPDLIGKWKSVYPMTFEDGWPLCKENVEICASRLGVSIITEQSDAEDDYTAWGEVALGRQIIGEWKSVAGKSGVAGGVFVLNINPNARYMYGYFTSPNEEGGFTYAGWILAKADPDEAKVETRLKKAQDLLSKTTIGFPA